jgi:hypothetical protein
MNTLIYYSINVLVLSVIVLIVGMFKPKWILLWMDKPGRMPVIIIASILFMAAAVMFGEGNKQLKQEQAQQTQQQSVQKPSAEVPVTPGAVPPPTP